MVSVTDQLKSAAQVFEKELSNARELILKEFGYDDPLGMQCLHQLNAQLVEFLKIKNHGLIRLENLLAQRHGQYVEANSKRNLKIERRKQSQKTEQRSWAIAVFLAGIVLIGLLSSAPPAPEKTADRDMTRTNHLHNSRINDLHASNQETVTAARPDGANAP